MRLLRHGASPSLSLVPRNKTRGTTQEDVLRTYYILLLKTKSLVQALYFCERTETAERLERSFPNKTRKTLQEANQTCSTSNEEAKVRRQPGEVNKCPLELRKSVFW